MHDEEHEKVYIVQDDGKILIENNNEGTKRIPLLFKEQYRAKRKTFLGKFSRIRSRNAKRQPSVTRILLFAEGKTSTNVHELAEICCRANKKKRRSRLIFLVLASKHWQLTLVARGKKFQLVFNLRKLNISINY